jgi:hypothetical protein
MYRSQYWRMGDSVYKEGSSAKRGKLKLCQTPSLTSSSTLYCIFTFVFIAEVHFAGRSLKGVRLRRASCPVRNVAQKDH